MQKVPVSDAKTHLLKLIREVMAGKNFAITRGGEIVARLIPPESYQTLPRFGFAQLKIVDDIVSPIPASWNFDAENIEPSQKVISRKSGKKKK